MPKTAFGEIAWDFSLVGGSVLLAKVGLTVEGDRLVWLEGDCEMGCKVVGEVVSLVGREEGRFEIQVG